MENLSQLQKQAVIFAGKSLLILAGPGTGKTRVIIGRILHEAKEKKTPADKILALTFSRKATQEMEDRLAEADIILAEKVQIKTLHSLGLEIVEKHGFRLGLGKKPQLITEAQSQLFLKKLTDQLPLLPLLKTSSIDPLLDDLLIFFSQCKDAGIWPEDLMRYANDLPQDNDDEASIKSEWSALADIYNAFQSKCFEEGYLDFGDCILLASRILVEFAIVREEVQNSYESILVDEFQDTNWTQIQFLKSLVGDKCRIAVVGDDDQSIYRFRGASYSAFDFFMEAFPKTEIIELTETYRLPSAISEVATDLISNNAERRFRPNKKIISKSKIKGEVVWLKSQAEKHEAQNIAKAIEEKIKRGISASKIALLVRSHSHGSAVAEELKKANILYQESSTRNLLESDAVKDCLALLKVAADPTDSVSFYRLLDSFFLRLTVEEAYKFCKIATTKKDLIASLEEQGDSPKNWASILKELTQLGLSGSPSDLLLSAFEKTDSIKYLLENDPQELKNLGIFFGQLKEWEKIQPQKELRSLIPLIEKLGSLVTSDQGLVDSSLTEAVSILTAHASKGLEFDHVIIPSLVSRRFPSNIRKPTWILPAKLSREAAFNSESHQDEERRLFYVAITRAKESLILSSFEKKGTRPSLFLNHDLKSSVDSGKIQIKSYLDESYSENILAVKPPFARQTPIENIPKPVVSDKPLSLSYTQLEKYETCPLSYQFKYDYQIPVRAPVQMSVGSAIHKALEIFFEKIQKDIEPNKEDLLQEFEKAFTEEKNKTPSLNETHLLLGKEKLAQYYDSYNGKFPKPFAIEKDFVLPVGPHKVRGKIDRIDKTPTGYRIIDYKTGRSKSNSNPEDLKFAQESLQFSIYALAAKEVFDWPIEELVFEYVYDCTRLSTSRKPDQLQKVKEEIQDIATRIQSRDFKATPGFHCQWCEYRSICPAAAV